MRPAPWAWSIAASTAESTPPDRKSPKGTSERICSTMAASIRPSSSPNASSGVSLRGVTSSADQ